jgi:hypothetical protein
MKNITLAQSKVKIPEFPFPEVLLFVCTNRPVYSCRVKVFWRQDYWLAGAVAVVVGLAGTCSPSSLVIGILVCYTGAIQLS